MRILVLVLVSAAACAEGGPTVGSAVETYNSGGWYAGRVEQVGTGEHAGYLYIHYDKFTTGGWIKASDVRLVKAAATPDASHGPRDGTYVILSYGTPSTPLRLGTFELKSGRYTSFGPGGNSLGSGRYEYDAARQEVAWKDGPFKDAAWTGKFEVSREGKTHLLRLNRVTVGTNSTDSR